MKNNNAKYNEGKSNLWVLEEKASMKAKKEIFSQTLQQ